MNEKYNKNKKKQNKTKRLTEYEKVEFEVKKAKYVSVGTYLLEVVFTKEPKERPTSMNKVFGSFLSAFPGDVFEAEGAFYETIYGITFYVKDVKRIIPSSSKAMLKFLKRIKGVGDKLGSKIVNELGERAIEIVNRKGKQVLIDIGVSPKKAETIEAQLRQFLRMEESLLYLISKGLEFDEAFSIYSKYGDSTIPMANSNPYVFTEEIGFRDAEKIAINSGFPKNSIERASGLLTHFIMQDIESGHLYSLKGEILEKFKSLEVKEKTFEEALSLLSRISKVKQKNEKIFLVSAEKTEDMISKEISERIKSPKRAYFDPLKVEEFILEFENSNSISFSDEQKDAIRMFSKNPIFVLTGGPGTGKTQTAKALVELSKRFGYTLSLACPTGKASARLSEVVGEYSSTIHRALEINGFSPSANKEIKEDIVLIDEMSMVGSFLFYELMRNVSESSKIVFVGDVDQIESVEAGNILESLIESGKIPTTRLRKVFRQAEGSKIVVNAHKIKNNDPDLEYGDDFKFVKKETDDEIMAHILKTYKYLREKLGYEAKDIAILSPSKKTSIGTYELNFQIQRHFNKSEDFIMSPSGIRFSTDDRIMQNVNNNEEGIYNGTTGSIAFINEKSVTLEFDDGAWVDYFKEELFDTVIHSYASTIHKYQGSEVKVVIVPLSFADKNMWNKKLFYTALTRAKNLFIMIGNEEIFRDHCMREPEKRRTFLTENIQKAI